MRLNFDCVRDILLTVENECDYHHAMNYYKDNNANNLLKKYNHEEIIYHIKQCELSGLILEVSFCDGGTHIIIEDLSPAGHQFLADVREDNVWKNVKDVAKKVGSISLNALTQISSNVIAQLIKDQFKNP